MFKVNYTISNLNPSCKETNGEFVVSLTECSADVLLLVKKNIDYLNDLIRIIRKDVSNYCSILTNKVKRLEKRSEDYAVHMKCTDDNVKVLLALIHLIKKNPNIIKTTSLDNIPITIEQGDYFGAKVFYNEDCLNLSIRNIEDYSDTENFYLDNVYLDYFKGKDYENDRPDFQKYYVYNFDNVLYIIEEL